MIVTINIGKKEKHKVSFHEQRLLGYGSVRIDGKEITRRTIFFGDNEFNFQVGEKEIHSIKLIVKIPWFPLIRKWTYELYIDGKYHRTF